jgi:photosynthetic reaction center cytochrome c subunit
MDRKPTLLFWLRVVAVGAIVFPAWGQTLNKGSAQESAQSANLPLPIEPTGASRCQVCHAAEVEGYARSAMAHSLRRAAQEPNGTVTIPGGKIAIYSSPAGCWQRLQSGGDVANYRIDYVVGSGNHASGYLLDLNGRLFQSPVAYYKSRHAYDLAPGYEAMRNPDFTRPIAEACVVCHSGSALKIRDTVNQYRAPVFSSEAITCQRCHGSAERHLDDPRAGNIVNPAKLEPAARDSICEQCHLLGVGRVLNPGKTFSDFQPGQRLEDVFTTYVNTVPEGAEAGKFKVISHVEQLARSTCARMSNGRLWCGTCHGPHNRPAEPVSFFRSKCLTCHTKSFSTSHPGKESNCIGCHMPRRDAKDGGHTAFTDHRIQRRPIQETALPAESDIAAWREPAAELQKRNLGIAYVNAGMERGSPPFVIRGYRMLAEVQEQFRADREVFSTIGNALLMGKQTSEAELAFERALQLEPDSVTGETDAASAYLQAGDVERATAHLERAVALDPLYLPADAPLIELYKRQGNAAKAEELARRVSEATNSESVSGDDAKKSKASSGSRAAEAVYKNIQVLKGTPADQVIPAMRFISASLGVECSYCHVQDHFEKDDKKAKQTARDMMRMMFAIDKESFSGNREVTCYSCHRGSLKPVATPIVGAERPASAKSEAGEKVTPPAVTADQLIDNYTQALGGAVAIDGIKSRVETGVAIQGGQSVPIEIFDQDPVKQAVVRHTPAGDNVTVFDGHEGWSSIPGHGMREMHGGDVDAATMDADLHFPLHIKERFAEIRAEYPEMVSDHEAYVISCRNVGQPGVKLYFDEQSGLLVRLVRYASSPLGLLPTQIDYGDYRDAGGVKAPFRRTVAQPGGSTTYQLEQIQENVAIDEAWFAKPASSATPVSKPATK